MNIDFEQFMEDTWDYVSERVVTDEYWNTNADLIREVTYELFQMREKSKRIENFMSDDGTYHRVYINRFSPKECGKILEAFFATVIKFPPVQDSSTEDYNIE